ncbi:hypothetical protein QBC45DRAFT_116555 [Copromyces sp. CBS 386.78]|nr:hypothetical protein QBC45DRAFT_116555 [Copromyces sp. CBS 386.78]
MASTWFSWLVLGSCKRVTRASDSICDENLPLRVGLCNAPSEPHSTLRHQDPCRHANKVLMELLLLTPENPHPSPISGLPYSQPGPTSGVRPGYHRGRSEQRSRIKAVFWNVSVGPTGCRRDRSSTDKWTVKIHNSHRGISQATTT